MGWVATIPALAEMGYFCEFALGGTPMSRRTAELFSPLLSLVFSTTTSSACGGGWSLTRRGSRTSRLLHVLGAFVSFAALGHAQLQPGTPSWSGYDSHAVDTINLSNLVVSLHIPVMSKTGAFPFRFGYSGASSYITLLGPNALYPGYIYSPLLAAANGAVGAAENLALPSTFRECYLPDW